MRKRKLYMSTALILMLVLLGACGKSASVDTKDGIKIGVLFSLSGGTAITEKSMADAAMLAIEEINQNGGVNGKDLVPIQEDYVSDPAQAATKAKKLILEDNVAAIIGGLTSASRQAMLPIVEQNNSLLIYPGPYEGEEYSKNILYTGAVPNQQLQTFIPWLTENVGKKVYLIGNDYVYPVETNNQVKKLLELSGGEVVGEEYVAMGESEFSTVLNNIRKAKPDYVFSTLVAESVPAFYSQYADYGMNSTEMPIASPTTSETEVAAISSEAAKGNISSLAYFENIDTPENASFVKAFHDKYGEDQPITTSMESAYFSVYLLAQTLEKIDDPYNTDELLANLIGQEFLAPEGKVKVDENNHTWLYSRIAKLDEQGEFEILQTSDTSIQPEPWSKLLFPDHEEPWKK